MHALLATIIRSKQREVAQLQQHSFQDFQRMPLFERPIHSLKNRLQQSFGIIAEIKRKSPGAGPIRPQLDVSGQVNLYARSGAAGISVLTDFPYFGGSIRDLETARSVCDLPLLRKEFIVHELQLFEAKAAGADAVLLIAAILEQQQAHHLTIIAKSLGLEVVFEIHSLRELDKLNDEIDLLLINNRNLDTQTTDVRHCLSLAPHLPAIPTIAASGICTAEEVQAICSAGYAGALIGESLLLNDHLHTLIPVACNNH